MDANDRAALLIHARIMEFRVSKIMERKDLPPIVRIHVMTAKTSVEKLVQAIMDGR